MGMIRESCVEVSRRRHRVENMVALNTKVLPREVLARTEVSKTDAE